MGNFLSRHAASELSMSKAEMTLQPDIEDLLVSIRKAIHRQDDGIIRESMESKMAGTIRDIQFHAAQVRSVARTLPAKRDRLNLDGLREPETTSRETMPSTYLPDYKPAIPHADAEAEWKTEDAAPFSSKATSLLSAQASDTANAAFSKLADTLMSRATGERSIEELTQDLLRSMLKQWLDANLPDMVERLVREEIERVARRGGRR